MKLQIEYIPVNELEEYSNNTRKHDTPDITQIAKSIEKYGFNDPIGIWSDHQVIVEGHGRLAAAKSLGMTEVPCVRLDHLTDEQRREYGIAHNKTAELSEWDFEKLEKELADLDMSEFDFGFEEETADENTEVIEDDYDEPLPEEPKAKVGDIYQLGRHRLMCGDSTSREDVARLMDGAKADMVFTDPPYGIAYSGGRTGGDNKTPHGQILNDELQGEDLANLICNTFTFNKAEADVYICCSPIVQKPFLDWLDRGGKKLDAVIVWDKKQAGLGYMAYRRQCEFILFVKGGKFHKGDRSDFDLWSISKDNTAEYVHGTQKPVAVPARAITNSSKKDDIVLDLFGGSGSTLLACEQLDRNARLMELDPKYVDVIIDRWEKLTGLKAIKIN